MEELEKKSPGGFAALSNLLYESWDPIGVQSLGGPKDEYERYAREIISRFSDDPDVTKIEDYLTATSTDKMKISCDWGKTRLTAKKTVQLLLSIQDH